ncbi:type II toxin-antitoxin system HicA family toxin [Nocardiopsis potens]|uniref:type II toxin-antitoxin system HicA family toxin n=1 Tax=Nocardiopsis potens TaxID=1246458 RepID=UPI00047691D9|nr:type II toxin-antitoxin system HicA family toxin [Nocardiopsis potens]
MKRKDLMRRLREIATDKEVDLVLVRQGAHEIWLLGRLRIPVPRHNEIAEGTAKAIIRRAEDA